MNKISRCSHSVDRTLFSRLILSGAFKGWCAGDLYRSRYGIYYRTRYPLA